ncbi:Dps family protein [Flavobacterium oreochromis]|uniref:DNA starvation/stationary phase protection protein n=2 Tax=Flavobacterium TaxID=237 RepID=A0A246G908_9FLAO|nr:DNA starvation/stationary phase protection protein [Flavobacterium oreochromis]OWP75342.1 DNA starvation/stationary phase protection protein [Flavobacterium oreochromis]OWP75803.1 DNA starvation/stationary phase protection protein [Flavobacterium oreochromis]POR23964.1 DNA starvation/stationary phase protection protein [Flavobacterium columnare]QYS86534.1 DNA starvation/stationary phase protection protein [Flavobacterium oreochromis]
MKINSLGLPVEETKELVIQLNALLSNFQIYYQNLRGLHWNIRGKRFFDLHLKFEELYNDSQLKIDMIAERILTLGGIPYHTFNDYLENSELTAGKNISNDEKAIKLIVASITTLLVIERKILKSSDVIDDEGTSSMMSDFIKEQEKTIWMMSAWLEETVD